jgi:hypothetical protein
MLEEVVFVDVKIIPLYFGLSMQNISFQDYPKKILRRHSPIFYLPQGVNQIDSEVLDPNPL